MKPMSTFCKPVTPSPVDEPCSAVIKYVVLNCTVTQSDSTVLKLILGDSVLSRPQHSLLAALISSCGKGNNESLDDDSCVFMIIKVCCLERMRAFGI